MPVTGSHDPWLVALSVLIACLASYTALDPAIRIKASAGWARCLWLAAAGVAMGGGIWSMHFVAMLAFSLNMPTSYGVGLTLFSLVTPMLVTGAAFFVVSRRSADWRHIALSGLVMG